MITILIDGKPFQVKEGKNLLEASLSFGFDVPYFCWHPALGSVGACRQCAVKLYKNEQDRRGKLVMACMTTATQDARISIDEPEAKAFRAGVIEWLMTNHPHDCPVCDEGGECHLQDMTVMTGHNYRRFRFKKRTFRNQYLGPFINHEMNRCIACYRCVRFYREYAGGRDLDVFSSRDQVYFGRHADGALESEFSGNLVEICPTGVFTDRTLKKHFTRKWDLQTAPSVCPHCSLGCNTIPGERYGVLRRIRNRYNYDLNGYFLCDRGRFGYEFVNSDRRVRRAWIRGRAVSAKSAVACLRASLRGDSARSRTLGIGSPRASVESNFALRALVGAERFHAGVSRKEFGLTRQALKILREGAAPAASLKEAEDSDAVLILGEDVSNVAPRLALALRQGGTRFALTSHATRLDPIVTEKMRLAPDEIARFGYAVAHAIDPAAPRPEGVPSNQAEMAGRIAHSLANAKRPLVVSGIHSGSEAILSAAANISESLRRIGADSKICLLFPECNSVGLGMMEGRELELAFSAMRGGQADTIIVLENDLFRRAPYSEVSAFLKAAREIVLIDHIATRVLPASHTIFPAASFAEGSGTFVNSEGRAQRFFAVMSPQEEIQESWRWVGEMMGRAWTLDEVMHDLGMALPELARVREAAPGASFRITGKKVARQPERYSGRAAITAQISVHEPEPPEDRDSPLAYSMEGAAEIPSPSLRPREWAPGWNSVQAVTKFQVEAGGPLYGGPSGTLLIDSTKRGRLKYFDIVPPVVVREGEWAAVPIYSVFGSEELSILAPTVAERASPPSLFLNEADAKRLGFSENDLASVTTAHEELRRLLVRIEPGLPDGVAGVSAESAVGLPASCRIKSATAVGAA